jgi:hypothetical protein
MGRSQRGDRLLAELEKVPVRAWQPSDRAVRFADRDEEGLRQLGYVE